MVIQDLALRIMTRWSCVDPIKNNILGLESSEFIRGVTQNIFDILTFGYNFEQDNTYDLTRNPLDQGSEH